MARDLRINIEGDSKGGRKALDDVADEADKAARAADHLSDEFKQAARSSAKLDGQLAVTRAELRRLREEWDKGGDPKVLKQIQEQYRELDKISRVKKRIGKEDDAAIGRAKKLADEAKNVLADAFTRNRRDSRGGLRNALGDLAGFGGRAATGAAGGIADVAGKIPGSKLALAGVGISALPAAGGAIGAGVLAGGALAGVGTGIAGAVANNPAPFKKAWAEAIESISKKWQNASSDFEKPTLAAMDTIRKAIEGIDLQKPLQAASKYVEPLARGISGFITSFSKGFGVLIEKAEPVITVLEKDLPLLGRAFETAFEDIGDGANGAANALDDIIQFIGVAIIAVGKFASVASDVYQVGQDVFGFLGGADVAAQTFGRTLDGATQSTFDMVQAQKEMADAARAASDQLDRQLGDLLSLSQANDAATVSLNELKQSFKDHGYILAGNTDAAIANRRALDDTVRAYEDQRNAAIEAGGSTKEAIDAANAVLLQHLEDLRAILVAHHADTTAIDAYIAKVKALDGQHPTVVIRVRYDVQSRPEGLPANLGTRYGGGDNSAGGGTVPFSGFRRVGEQGPEIQWADKSNYFSTAQETKRLMSAWSTMANGGGGGGRGAEVTMRLAGAADSLAGQFIQQLMARGQLQFFDSTGQPVRVRP